MWQRPSPTTIKRTCFLCGAEFDTPRHMAIMKCEVCLTVAVVAVGEKMTRFTLFTRDELEPLTRRLGELGIKFELRMR